MGNRRPWAGRRRSAQERAFAGVGHADQADIGDEFQFQSQSALLAFGAGFGIARGLVGGAFEMPVAAPAFAAAGDHDGFSRHVEIGQKDFMLFIENQRTGRDGDDEILAAEAGHFLTHAGFAAFGAPMVPAGEIEKGVFIGIGDEDDAAAVAAVASFGSALGNIFFAAEGDATVPAVAGVDFDDGFVNEHSSRSPLAAYTTVERTELADP